MSVVFFVSDISSTSVKFCAGIKAYYTQVTGYKFKIYKGTTLIDSVYLPGSFTISGSTRYDTEYYTFTELSPSTNYTIEAYFFQDGSQSESSVDGEFRGTYEFSTYAVGKTDFMSITMDDGYPTETEVKASVFFDESEKYGYYSIHYSLLDINGNVVSSYTHSLYSNNHWCWFGDLFPNTEYTINIAIYCYRNSTDTVSSNYKEGFLSFKTKPFGGSGTTNPPDISGVVITQNYSVTTGTQIGFYAAGFDTSYPDTLKVTFFVRQGSTSGSTVSNTLSAYISPGYSETITVTVDGLTPGTSYYVAANIETSSGHKQATAWFLCETVPPDDSIFPDFDSVNILHIPNTSSLFVQLSGMNTTGYEYGNFNPITWRIYTSNYVQIGRSQDDIAYLGNDTSEGVTFTGLAQNTEYYVEASIRYRYAGGYECTYLC